MKQKYSQILENDGVGKEYFGRVLGRGLSKEEMFKLRSEKVKEQARKKSEEHFRERKP